MAEVATPLSIRLGYVNLGLGWMRDGTRPSNQPGALAIGHRSPQIGVWPKATTAAATGIPPGSNHVRICANKVVACVRSSTLLPNIRPQETRQFASA